MRPDQHCKKHTDILILIEDMDLCAKYLYRTEYPPFQIRARIQSQYIHSMISYNDDLYNQYSMIVKRYIWDKDILRSSLKDIYESKQLNNYHE